MDMASQNGSPKRGYPSPDKKLAGPGRLLPPDRNPSFAFNIPPCTPSFHYQDRLLTPPSMFRNTLLRDQRRRHFQNNNYTTTNSTTTSSHDKTKTCLIGAIVGIPVTMFYVLDHILLPSMFNKLPFTTLSFTTTLQGSHLCFNITMKMNNPARHIGVFYEYDNSIIASYSGIRLCSGGIPPFFQPPKGEMLVQSPLTGLGVILPDDINQKLENDNRNHRAPLTLNMMGMVRFKMGSVTSRALLVSCEIALDNLITYTPKLISSSCDSTAGFWFAITGN